MSSRKTLGKVSIKVPRGKIKEIGEGSHNRPIKIEDPAKDYVHVTAKDYVQVIIQLMATEEPLSRPIFKDIKASTETQVLLLGWKELFLKFKNEYYLGIVPHGDPTIRQVDDRVFMNIRKSCLHFVAARASVFSCFGAIKWIIDHTILNNCMFVNTMGNSIGSFLAEHFKKYYKFQKPEVKLVTSFVHEFYDKNDVEKIIAIWWKEDRKFVNRASGWYTITNLRELYLYLMVLICKLYGQKDCSRFSNAWLSLAYTMATTGKLFNWGGILLINWVL
jgi:hypothetical protein